MKFVLRQEYLDKIERVLGKGAIVVLTGQRRVGKSCILRMLRESKEAGGDANVIFIDKENRSFDAIRSYEDLNAYLEMRMDRGRHNYIFIDEIQNIVGFEHSLRSFRNEPDTDIVVTGSNAAILSSDLSTLIGGRYVEIYIHSLSYTEFIRFHGLEDNDTSLGLYVSMGGLPALSVIGLDEELARDYQMSIYRTILLKDVVIRNGIRNVTFLENLVTFLADNSGKLISANAVSKYMRSQGEIVTSPVVQNYLRFLCDTYMIRELRRYDIHGKRIFETNAKYYFEDVGLRNAIAGGSREGDIEKCIENLVWQHLSRIGFYVQVGQLQAGEVDFVCSKPNGCRVYVQAAYVIADETTKKREFGSLERIRENYPKYVVSMTPLLTRSDSGGIVHLHLRHFLSLTDL